MPAKYTYRPYNYAAFAQPLAQMQQRYDVAQQALADQDFNFAHLSYGEDPEKAKALIEEMSGKRDALSKDLMRTKNFRKAALELKSMQKEWQNNEHRKALESNYNQWATLDKEQRERMSKGDISRDAYYDWRNRSIEEFTALGGTNFEGPGHYTKLGRIERLKDLEKEYEDLQFKIANATPEKVIETFNSQGIPLTGGDIDRIESTIKYKSKKEIEAVTEEYMKKIPRFQKYFAEQADYEYWKRTRGEGGEDRAKQMGKDLLGQEVARIDAQLKSGKYSEEDTKLLKQRRSEFQGMIDSNSPDADLTKRLFAENYIAMRNDASAIADVLDYRNVTHQHNITKGKSAAELALEELLSGASFTEIGYKPTDFLKGLVARTNESEQNLRTSTEMINSMGDGAFGNVMKGVNTNQNALYNAVYEKHPELMTTRLKGIVNAFPTTTDEEGNVKIKQGAKKEFIANLSRQFGKKWLDNVNHNELDKIYDFYSNPNHESARHELSNQLSNIDIEYQNMIDGKRQLKHLREETEKTSEFKQFFLRSSLQNTNSYGISLSQEDINKAKEMGFPVSYIGSGSYSEQRANMSLKDYMRVKGYNTMEEAVEGLTQISPRYKESIKNLRQEILENNQDIIDQMSYRYIRDKNVDEYLSAEFNGAPDLTAFKPAFSSSWNNIAGFTETGELDPETVMDAKGDRNVKLVRHGNRMLFEVPIKRIDENTGDLKDDMVYVTPKKGWLKGEQGARLMKYLEATSANNPETNDMVKVMKFDYKYNNLISDEVFSIIPVTKDSPSYKIGNDNYNTEEVSTFTPDSRYPGAKIKFIKAVPEGTSTPKILLQDSNGNFITTINEEGKEVLYRATTADDAKAFIMKRYNL